MAIEHWPDDGMMTTIDTTTMLHDRQYHHRPPRAPLPANPKNDNYPKLKLGITLPNRNKQEKQTMAIDTGFINNQGFPNFNRLPNASPKQSFPMNEHRTLSEFEVKEKLSIADTRSAVAVDSLISKLQATRNTVEFKLNNLTISEIPDSKSTQSKHVEAVVTLVTPEFPGYAVVANEYVEGLLRSLGVEPGVCRILISVELTDYKREG